MPGKSPSVSWTEFREQSPEIAAKAVPLLSPDGEAPCAFMATVSMLGRVHLSPVNPIFCGDDIYISAGAHTPKSEDLAGVGTYVLHAFLGANDEEFQVSGHAELITDEAHRAKVHDAIQFPSFDPNDPVFRLRISHALWSTWVLDRNPQAIKKTWRAGAR